jgi:hypothetical protein
MASTKLKKAGAMPAFFIARNAWRKHRFVV